MKKYKKFSALAACAATMAVGAGLVGGGGVYAEGALSRIYVYDGTTSCNIYYAGGQPDCEESYGSYDVATGTLTLGAGVNGKSVYIVDISEPGNSYTIKASADISAGLSTPGYATITFDLENHSWTQPAEDPKQFSMPIYGDTIFKTGTFNLTSIFSNNNLRIDGGVLNVNGTGELATGDVWAKTFVMNDGFLNIKNGNLEQANSIEINGGNIEIENPYGFGGCIDLYGDSATFDLNGGSVTLDADGYSRSGIYGTYGKNKVVNISGGSLNVNNTEYGIQLTGGDDKINFLGGVTTIKKSSKYAVRISDVSDPENAIGFGQSMGIMEQNLHVFLDEDSTGIVAEDVVTIAEGGAVKKYYGWEIGDGDPDVEVPSTGAKTPDTGVFSGENSGAMIAMISMGALAAIAGGAYMINYVTKRYSARAKFFKK